MGKNCQGIDIDGSFGRARRPSTRDRVRSIYREMLFCEPVTLSFLSPGDFFPFSL